MTREELRQVGEKVGEYDFNNNGIYTGTWEHYLYNNELWVISTMLERKNNCWVIDPNVEKSITDINGWCWCTDRRAPKSAYIKVCEKYGIEPDLKHLENEED